MVNEHTEKLNYTLQLAIARECVRMALANARNPIVSTKFSEESAIFLHLASQIRPGVDVIWVDTGYNTRDTVAFSRELVGRLDISLHVFEPENHTITMPPALDDPEHAEFSRQVKIEPFQRALRSLQADVWLSSIRRYQSNHRRNLTSFQTQSDGLLKVSPLLDWTPGTLARYRQEHELPLGPACFDPTKGEPFRECGLHLDRVG
ncbi:MAG: phosphoadenosine phosphosulfate reductase family protein [Granulosicoccus sp.]|nr:phosphoadenosine phosphosulfate reductase family protein [Granulosicoccus sp.]